MHHIVLGYITSSISEIGEVVYSGDCGDAAIAAAVKRSGDFERFIHCKNPQDHGFKMSVPTAEESAETSAPESPAKPRKGK